MQFTNIHSHGNTRLTFDSYSWGLAKLLQQQRRNNSLGTFDFAYLDGSHTFIHDAPAAILLTEMVKPGGYLLLDDLNWTFSTSPSMNPTMRPEVATWFTNEQISTKQVSMICELFLEHDPKLCRNTMDGKISSGRALYRKAA